MVMIGFKPYPRDHWEYKMSEFHQGRVLFMIPPIRFYFGKFSKYASNAEKGKLVHPAQEEKVMCYHISAVKCLTIIFFPPKATIKSNYHNEHYFQI